MSTTPPQEPWGEHPAEDSPPDGTPGPPPDHPAPPPPGTYQPPPGYQTPPAPTNYPPPPPTNYPPPPPGNYPPPPPGNYPPPPPTNYPPPPPGNYPPPPPGNYPPPPPTPGGYPPPPGSWQQPSGYPPPPPAGGYPPPPGSWQQPQQPGGGWSGGSSQPAGYLAGWWRRVGASLVDGLLIGVVSAVVLTAAGVSPVARTFIEVLVQVAYQTFMLGGNGGRTVGNLAASTRVVDAGTGAPPGYDKAVIRVLVGAVLPFTIIGGILDVLWPLWDPQNQTLHDKAAGTVVLRTDMLG